MYKDYFEYDLKKIKFETDIEYARKIDCNNHEISLKLDIYGTDDVSDKERPVIIWVHGGGMYTGSKNESWEPVILLASDFAHKGYVCVSIDYRLNPHWEETGAFTKTIKDAAEDVASSIEWVKDNAEKYNIDKEKIILAGYSSGAEIIDNFYFSNFLVDGKNFDKSGIKAVISISGNRLFFDNEAVSEDDDVRCLIIHGDADDINPISDAETFLSQLCGRGEIKVLAGNGHFWTETEEQKDFLRNSISDFLRSNTNG